MTETPIFIIDAFIGVLGERILRGNPAAVVLLEAPRDACWMQEVAAEMNLSETAFLIQTDDCDFELRWFTPRCEVGLCGHATLAGAHHLWDCGRIAGGAAIRFHTQSGILSARREVETHAEAKIEWVWIDLPAPSLKTVDAPTDLSLALGFSPGESVAFHRAGEDLLALVPVTAIGTTRPDFAWLGQICRQLKVRGLIVTAQSQAGRSYDFVSRFFAPAIGLDEDPVTGSAHAALAHFWGERLGQTELTGFQASARGGLVRVRCCGARTHLAGRAQTTLRGVLSM